MTTRPRPRRRGAARRRPFPVVVATLALLAVLAGGCGSDSSTSGSPGGSAAPAGTVKIKVGILPIADVAPLWYGMDKGFFAAEGLEVETALAQGGAAIVPSVMSGEYQFGFSNVVSLMLAREKGAKVKLVSNVVNGGDAVDQRGANAILVAPNKGIASIKDLAGKKFAVNTQKNVGEVTIKATLRNAGVDISGVSFAEYGFPNMNGALQSGQVDAIWQAEPFVTLGLDSGFTFIANPMAGTTPNMTIAGFFASEDYLEANADVANRFKRAVAKSLTESARDEAGIRATIASKTQTPPGVVPRMTLPLWKVDLNIPSIELQGNLAKEFGILEDQPDTGELVWSP